MSDSNSRMAVQYPANPVVARLIRWCLYSGESHVDEMYWLAMHTVIHQEIEELEAMGEKFLPFVRHTRQSTYSLAHQFRGDPHYQRFLECIRRGNQYE
jgi:hypothetical protein